MSGLDPYKTIAAPTRFEMPAIKGSRFIALAHPVSTDDEAMTLLKSIQMDFADARHWCWAYQLREQQRTRFHDDGEPSGSAGKPILAPIIGNDILNCMVVVVRYFGGTKLGVGGLVRAYSQASNAVLDHANTITITPTITLCLQYRYDDTASIATTLAQFDLSEENVVYTDSVSSELQVVPSLVDDVIMQITNRTGGRASINTLESSKKCAVQVNSK